VPWDTGTAPNHFKVIQGGMYQEHQAKWQAWRKLFAKSLHFHLLYESDTKLNAVLNPELPKSGIPQNLYIKKLVFGLSFTFCT